MKLNLGCGNKKAEGWVNVDKVQTEASDQLVDLFEFPWPWEDESIDQIQAIHFFEHVPAKLRGKFMDEVYRILKPECLFSIIVPAYNSSRYYQDFTHEWPPLVPGSFYYFNKSWREKQGLTHGDYDLKSDFDAQFGYNMRQDWLLKTTEVQTFASEHYWNAATDMIVNLTKRG